MESMAPLLRQGGDTVCRQGRLNKSFVYYSMYIVSCKLHPHHLPQFLRRLPRRVKGKFYVNGWSAELAYRSFYEFNKQWTKGAERGRQGQKHMNSSVGFYRNIIHQTKRDNIKLQLRVLDSAQFIGYLFFGKHR